MPVKTRHTFTTTAEFLLYACSIPIMKMSLIIYLQHVSILHAFNTKLQNSLYLQHFHQDILFTPSILQSFNAIAEFLIYTSSISIRKISMIFYFPHLSILQSCNAIAGALKKVLFAASLSILQVRRGIITEGVAKSFLRASLRNNKWAFYY